MMANPGLWLESCLSGPPGVWGYGGILPHGDWSHCQWSGSWGGRALGKSSEGYGLSQQDRWHQQRGFAWPAEDWAGEVSSVPWPLWVGFCWAVLYSQYSLYSTVFSTLQSVDCRVQSSLITPYYIKQAWKNLSTCHVSEPWIRAGVTKRWKSNPNLRECNCPVPMPA